MLINDHFQNFKSYGIQKAQLIIADIPYNLGNNAYASNPSWYEDGDNKNGESNLAGKEFFDTDKNFKPAEFMHFCSKMLKKEPKAKGQAPCMIVFCAFDQQFPLIELAKRYGLNNYINLVFRKNFSAQVLKANMKVVGNCEYGLLFYREKLPKFNNNGKMIFNCIDWVKDGKEVPKLHPCLPAGEKVYFNREWMNIEDVKIGYKNEFGEVINTSTHYAESIVEITVNGEKTRATWNHPFLIKRDNKIYWTHANNITDKDFILQKVFVYCTQKPIIYKKWKRKLQRRGILGQGLIKMVDSVSSIHLYGKNIMGKFLWECKFIIKMATKQTIQLKTSSLSRHLNTDGFTQVADLSMENGKNRARYVENIKKLTKRIGIFRGDGSMGEYAKSASLRNRCMKEQFVSQKVGSVKNIETNIKVYNLTMNNVPAFDTSIGVSHNTQKPINLLKKLIEIFTDEGDIVIDPCAGSGSTLIAALETNRRPYGFEIKKDFYKDSNAYFELRKRQLKEIREQGFTSEEDALPSLF